jgi:hypothetical protein
LKAIVHIGTEKTGTTSIQKYLFQNRKKLRTAGFHFLQSAGSTNNRALPAYFVAEDRFDDFYRDEGITTLEAKAEFRKQFLEKFENEIGALPKSVHTVVISSEHFHSRLRSTQELDKVHEFFTSYFDEIKIICYLRDQVSTCASFYSTGLKSGNPATFTEFFQRCTPENYYFNYYDVLSNWERCFGFDSLDVSLFSRKSFLNNSLLDDFTAKLDPALIGVLNNEIAIENESLNPIGQAMARGLNLALPVRRSRPELAQIRDKCKASIYQKFRGTGRQPSLATQQKIYRDFTESNELLRKKFFPHLALIFEPPVEEPAPITGVDESFVEGIVSLFNELRKHGKDIIRSDEYAEITQGILSGLFDVFESELNTDGKNELNKKRSANKPKDRGIQTVISKAHLRSLVFAAGSIESKDPKSAREVLRLVQEIDPTGTDISAKLEAIERKEALLQLSKYAITYTSVAESHDPEERLRRVEEFGAWLSSFADCIDGAVLNDLRDTNSLRRVNAELVRKPSMSAGFVIVRVDCEEAAYAIAERCPHLLHGGMVFVSHVALITP